MHTKKVIGTFALIAATLAIAPQAAASTGCNYATTIAGCTETIVEGVPVNQAIEFYKAFGSATLACWEEAPDIYHCVIVQPVAPIIAFTG
jgi:hypothetical protein